MIISEINQTTANGLVTIQATISWENFDRKPFQFFVQTPAENEDALWTDANSLLIGSILTAWHYKEKRVRIDGTVCPMLASNLEGVFMMMKSWYPDDFDETPVIEPTGGFKSMLPPKSGTVSLMSGGIDSLCLLRANHLFYPKGHTSRISAVVPIEMTKEAASDRQHFDLAFEGRMTSIGPVAEEAEVRVMPARTNLWFLNPDGYFYGQKSYASQLSSILSFFSKGFDHGLIASSYDAAYSSKPWGSNPQLDAYFTSAHFRMENSGTEMTRLRKVEIVADWPIGYKSIRVCQNDNTGGSNCGTCEKCIRTKLMLESLGKLRDCQSFPENYIDTDLLGYLETYKMLPSTDAMHNEEKIYQYGLTIPYLKRRGRMDLVEALEAILDKLRPNENAAIKETEHDMSF